ncbi:unnamed protein product [Didymodactylos carnosus]|uniref:Uncharacterized protein n=1 Tax=Didymodactylos carnosus TaxID=1234261 RepID=A0A813THR3_9BILA|nr:unnamed protein product [Didymodactylos carnosus]CAF0809272.1 unnamed protein product [Didymodactylos carnosus]CAF3524782.1 unnamed protein product [Didymodactylos carnosus]CAF3594831.1 unnamed protein product [Didymodactylos carnosus]
MSPRILASISSKRSDGLLNVFWFNSHIGTINPVSGGIAMSNIADEILSSSVDDASIVQPRKSIKKIIYSDDDDDDDDVDNNKNKEKKNQDEESILSDREDDVDEFITIKKNKQTRIIRNDSFSDNDNVELTEPSYVSKSRISFTPPSPSSSDEKLINDDPFSDILKRVNNENSSESKFKMMDKLDLYDADEGHENIEIHTDEEDDIGKIKKSGGTKKPRKPTKAAVLEVQKNTQKLLRESTFRLPYHKPEQFTSIAAFLNKRKSQTQKVAEMVEITPAPVLTTAEIQLKILTDMISDVQTEEKTLSTSIHPVNEKLARHIPESLMKKKPTLAKNINQEQIIDLNNCAIKKNERVSQVSDNKSLLSDKTITKSKTLYHLQELLRVQVTQKCRNEYLKNQIESTTPPDRKQHFSPPIKKKTPIRMIKDPDDEDSDDEDFILEDENQRSDDHSETGESDEDTKSDDDHSIIKNKNEKSEDNVETKTETNIVDKTVPDGPVNPILKQKLSYDDDDDIIRPNLPLAQISQQQGDSYKENSLLRSDSELSQREPNVGQLWCGKSQTPLSALDDVALLCSGQFTEVDIPCSQNRLNDFFILPQLPVPQTSIDLAHSSENGPSLVSSVVTTLPEDKEDDIEIPVIKRKIRRISESSNDDDQSMADEVDAYDSEEEPEEEQEEQTNVENNEELMEFRQSLFEVEAEESGSEVGDKDDDEIEDDSNDVPDEELLKFIDTDQTDLNEKNLNDLSKVHMKIMNKEDEQKLKMLKDRYLDNDEDDVDGTFLRRRPSNDEDFDEDTNVDEDDDLMTNIDDIDENTNEIELKNKKNHLERERLFQDIQTEELHLNEDIQTIGNDSQIFKLGCVIRQKKIQSSISAIDTDEDKETKQKEARLIYSAAFTSTTTQVIPVSSLKRLSSRYDQLTSKCSAGMNGSTTAKNVKHDPRRLVFSTSNKNNSQIEDADENEPPITNEKSFDPNKFQARDKRSNIMDDSMSSNKRFKSLKSPTFTPPTPTTSTTNRTSIFSKLYD